MDRPAREGQFFGGILRDVRKARELTIEDVASLSNWSTSQIQKIETGQTAKRATVEDLLYVMDMKDVAYDDFFVDMDVEIHSAREAVCEQIERRDMDRALQRLELYRGLVDSIRDEQGGGMAHDRNAALQFYRFAQKLVMADYENKWLWYISDWLSILGMSKPGYEPGVIRTEDLKLSRQERMVVNALAVCCLWEGEVSRATAIISALIRTMSTVRGTAYHRQRAVLCNNMALCHIRNKEWEKCIPVLQTGFRSCDVAGGSCIYLNLIRTQIKVNAHLYGSDEAKRLYRKVRILYEIEYEADRKYESFEEFWYSPSELFIF